MFSSEWWPSVAAQAVCLNAYCINAFELSPVESCLAAGSEMDLSKTRDLLDATASAVLAPEITLGLDTVPIPPRVVAKA